MIVAGLTETAYGQSSLPIDTNCICYTDAMDKKALECLVNAPKKDSLISNYSLQIANFKSIVINQGILVSSLEADNLSKTEENQKLNLHLERSKRTTKIFGVGGVCVGFVGCLMILK
jgi:hypothetical protein